MKKSKIIALIIFTIICIGIFIFYLYGNHSDKINNLLILLLGILIQSIIVLIIFSIFNEKKEHDQFKAIDAKIKNDLNVIVTILVGTLNISVVDKFGFTDWKNIEEEIKKAMYKIKHYKDFPIEHVKVDSFGFYWFNSEKVVSALKIIDSLLSLFPNRLSPEIKDALYELNLELIGSKNAEFWSWNSQENLGVKEIQHNYRILNKTKDIYQHCYDLWKINNKV